MSPLGRFLLAGLVIAMAAGWEVGSTSEPVVQPVGDERDSARFTFRVTTPAVSAVTDER